MRESRERVRAALINSGFEFPLRRIVVNISPSTRKKAGPGLDLPIAVALLEASGQIAPWTLSQVPIIGELTLDGSLREVPGAVAFARDATKQGRSEIMVPAENGSEAALVEGIEVIALDHLRSITGVVAWKREAFRPQPQSLQGEVDEHAPDLGDLRGQPRLRRALTVAAAACRETPSFDPAPDERERSIRSRACIELYQPPSGSAVSPPVSRSPPHHQPCRLGWGKPSSGRGNACPPGRPLSR